MKSLLEVNGLRIQFKTPHGIVTVVDDINFKVNSRETLCIVGESGCGKSVTALSALRLLADNGIYAGGKIFFDDQDLTTLSDKEITKIRGKDISMIFQEPMTSLNPVHRVGDQIAESFRIHLRESKKTIWQKSVEMLDLVGVIDADRIAKCYPHQLSGGMRQRVMIAMAMACNPKLLIADEPTTALDVTIQAQILDILKDLQKKTGMSVMFITHDLGIVAEIADYIMVMYAGKIVEEGYPSELYKKPHHPYTEGLLKCIPRVDMDKEILETIEGNVPDSASYSEGCRFCNRCKYSQEICITKMPELKKVGNGKVACHFPIDRYIEL